MLGEVSVLRALVRLRHQHPAVPADHLVAGVAEQPLGRRIEHLDRPVLIDRHDAVGAVVHHRAEAGGFLRTLLLGAPALAHVAEHQHAAEHAALDIEDRCSAVVDGPLAAILADERGVVGEPHDGGVAYRPPSRILHGRARALVDDAKHAFERLLQHLLRRPARHGLGNGVGEGDAAIVVGREHRIADAAERHAQSLALGGDLGGSALLQAKASPAQVEHEHEQGPGDHGRGEDRHDDPTGAALGLLGAAVEERVLRGLHRAHLGADLVHQRLTRVPLDDRQGRRTRARLIERESALELLEFPGRKSAQRHEPSLLSGSELAREAGELTLDLRGPVAVRLEVGLVPGEQIAPLTRLGIFE